MLRNLSAGVPCVCVSHPAGGGRVMRKLSVFRGFVRVSRVISMARLRALYNPRPNVAANSDRQSRAYGLIDEHSHEPKVRAATAKGTH